MSVRPGDELELELEDPSFGGTCVAHAPDGRVILVSGGAPGDRALVRITRGERRHAYGVVERLQRGGDGRMPAFCPVQAECGGCPWQVVRPERQAQVLERHVRHVVERALKTSRRAPPTWLPIWTEGASETPRGWRSTARLHVQGGRLGYYAPGSRTLIAPDACAVLAPPLDQVFARVSSTLALAGLEALRGVARLTGSPSSESGTVDLELHGEGERGRVDAETLTRTQSWARHLVGLGGAVHGVRLRVAAQVWTWGTCTDLLGEESVPHPTGTFVQAHQRGWRSLVPEVVAWMGPPGALGALELFAGSGGFTFALATAGWRVTTVERDAEAAARLAAEAARRGAAIEARVGEAAENLVGRHDAVLLDPPRAGAQDVVEALPRSTGVVVYVSCDPATLARDTEVLVRRGWRLDRVRAWDLFPHTGHVEIVSRFVH
ncbi:MAG: class I SAM-dependent RNA methyltransferase [Bradymonadia bacterium]